MSYHLRRIPLASLPVMVPGFPLEPEPREATAQDLLNMGLVEVGRDDAFAYYDCCELDDEKAALLPGEKVPLASGYVAARTARLPAAVQKRVMRARVYRHRNPAQSLRHLVNDNTDPERLPAKVPATGKTTAKPPSLPKALSALEQAKLMAAADPNDPEVVPDAIGLLVPMSEVQDGDVVEADSLFANRWSGEPDY